MNGENSKYSGKRILVVGKDSMLTNLYKKFTNYIAGEYVSENFILSEDFNVPDKYYYRAFLAGLNRKGLNLINKISAEEIIFISGSGFIKRDVLSKAKSARKNVSFMMSSDVNLDKMREILR